MDDLKSSILADATAICSSVLTDWQKIDAINTFVISKLQYYLRAALPSRSWVQTIDDSIRALLKKGLSLPRRTITGLFYTHKTQGGLGLFSFLDNWHVATITQLSRCANSPDSMVRSIARDQLVETHKHRRRRVRDTPPEESLSALSAFLNSPVSTEERTVRDVQSLWSEARNSIQLLGLSLTVTNNGISIGSGDSTFDPKKPALLTKFIRAFFRSRHLDTLLEAPDQGRAYQLAHLHHASNYWLKSGHYMSFAEYRFALKARCNLLPTRTVLKKIGRISGDTKCRVCKREPETLAHVLNGCVHSSGLMRERHNAVLSRLSKAVSTPNATVLMDQKVPDSPCQLRPDLCIIEKDALTLIDVTIPIESGVDAFKKARAEKKSKYSDLVIWARSKFPSVHYDSFLVGSLGSWDVANEDVLKRLGIGKKYSELFRKLCCLDAIKGSLQMWRAFCAPSP